jgi:hypothetical protein
MRKDAKIGRPQISLLLGKLVTFQERFSPLPFYDGIWAIENPKLAINLFIEAIQNRPREEVKIVTKIFSSVVASTTIQATGLKFIVNDYFIASLKESAKTKIAFLGESFKLWFENKIEPKFLGSTIEGRDLVRSANASAIFAEFGERKKVETTLKEVYDLMSCQKNGGKGCLLTNGAANIFFVGDINNQLRVVRVRFYGGYWRVNSYLVTRWTKWQVGDRFFCRKPRQLQ